MTNNPNDPLVDEALDVADRRPAGATSSEGLRLLDRLLRLFGTHESDQRSDTPSLFSWGTLDVRRKLGEGSFGEVFAAWDATLHREVALKLRSPEVGSLRWLDEARNLARIRHTHVLNVYGADVIDGRAGIWTELITGRSLEEELESNGIFTAQETLRIGRDIASALVSVHAAGLVHGDVKTANIMLEDGAAPRRAVLVDFGAADRMAVDGDMPAYLVGTPLTMAPEVLDGQAASACADVYGLGVTMFRLLTKRYPVEAKNIDELKRAHATKERAALRTLAPNVSPKLARVIERALEPAPAERWPDAAALRTALDDVADPTRRIRNRAAAIGAGVAALAAIVVVAVLMTRPGEGPLTRGRLAAVESPDLWREGWRYSSPTTGLGYHLRVGAADLDGDGHDDLLVSESRAKTAGFPGRGRVSIYRGGANGPDSVSSEGIAARDTSYLMGMDGAARAGDVNHDGFEDILVTEQMPLVPLTGRVSLYPGGPRGHALAPVWSVVGSGYDSGLGRSMMAAGDVNHDGFDDVVIGELRASDPVNEEGVDRLYLGSAAGLSPTPAWEAHGGQAHGELGSWMRAAGDVNGDGFDDILLGAQGWDGAKGNNCGLARLYFGNAHGADAQPAWSHEGDGSGFLFGCCTSGAGDVNGDGYADIVIGERQYSDGQRPERGRVLVFLGGANGPSNDPSWTALGPVAFAHFGFCVAGIGDIDGDGFDDIAISAPDYTEGKMTSCGFVEVYRGGKNGLNNKPAWRVVGDRTGAALGYFVGTADINGDHVPDLLVRAPTWGDSISERGLIVAYLGSRPK